MSLWAGLWNIVDQLSRGAADAINSLEHPELLYLLVFGVFVWSLWKTRHKGEESHGGGLE